MGTGFPAPIEPETAPMPAHDRLLPDYRHGLQDLRKQPVFILIMLDFLLQWLTLLTLAMFPILVWIYAHLARQEEREAIAEFGDAYAEPARSVPAFVPRLVARPGGVAQ